MPSNRRSILAASCAQRSSCLPGKRAEAGREAEPTGASERRRRSARREGPGAGGMQGAGTAPARPPAWPGPGRPHASRRPAERGQQPTAASPPGHRRARLRLWEQSKGYARLSHPRRTGLSRRTSGGRGAPPPTRGCLRAQPHVGKGAEGGECAPFPFTEGEVGGQGVGAQISAGGLGTPAARCEGERAAASWFPRPGALRIPLVSEFPPASASAGSRPGPGSAWHRHGRLRRGGAEPGECGQERVAGRVARPCASRPPRASPGGPGGPGPAPPGWPLARSPGSRPRRRHAQPRRNPVQPRRSGTRAQERPWRGPDVRWEGEAEDEGLSPRRTAARQSPQDIFPPQLCGPSPSFYRPWGTEDPGEPLEDTYGCENPAALGRTVSVQGLGPGRRRFSNS